VLVMKPNELMHYMGDIEIDAADALWLGKEAPVPTEQEDQSGIVTLSWTRYEPSPYPRAIVIVCSQWAHSKIL
jgi:hypothetical protein